VLFNFNISSLIALGIEQFLPFILSKPSKFKTKKMQLVDTSELISHYLLPCRDAQGIFSHIKKCRAAGNDNPIKVYIEHYSYFITAIV